MNYTFTNIHFFHIKLINYSKDKIKLINLFENKNIKKKLK